MEFVRSTNLRPVRAVGELFVHSQSTKATQPEVAIAKDERGICIFREHRRCTLHVVGGEAMLPTACRHYPRILRRDATQTALTLSHYCPTAAALLLTPDSLEVTTARPPLEIHEPLDGLDARGALPPLLHPHMLMDAAGYAAWEEAVVSAFARETSPGAGLAWIGSATDHLRQWNPGCGPLDIAITSAFGSTNGAGPPPTWMLQLLPLVRSLNKGAVTLDDDEHLDARWMAIAPEDARVVRNYLAARAFGNWIAYQGRGLRSVVAWLSACHDVLRLLACRAAEERGSRVLADDLVEAARHADYVMLHTVDSQAFAHAVAGIESP